MTGFKPGDRVQPAAHCQDTWPASAGTVVAPESSPVRVAWDNAAMITIHPPTNLEPLGEPMSKRTDFLDADGSPMTIEGRAEHKNWAIKFVSTYREFTPEDAPTLALAILEAAGTELVPSESYETGSLDQLRDAAYELSKYIEARDEATKEAADREALEGEALTLCRVMWDNSDQQWEPMSSKAKTTWVAMARTAREMHNR